MLTPDWHPDDARLRQFALGCLLAAALLGYVAYERTGSIHLVYGLATVGASGFVVGRVKPSLLQPAYYVFLIVVQPVLAVSLQFLVVEQLFGNIDLAVKQRHLDRDDGCNESQRAKHAHGSVSVLVSQ